MKKPIPRSNATLFQPIALPPTGGCGDTNVTVNVTVNEKQEGEITGCLKSLFGCAKKAAK